MRFGYTIIYVDDVEATLSFYERAFNLKSRFLHKSKQYGELETGQTTLAFASVELAESNGVKFVKNEKNKTAAGFEIGLITDHVMNAYEKACAEGAVAVQDPAQKPWGQTVAYVRDINGVIIEICTPMS